MLPLHFDSVFCFKELKLSQNSETTKTFFFNI